MESGSQGSEGAMGMEGDGQLEAGDESQQQQRKKPTPKMRKIKVNEREEYVDEDQVFRDYQKYRGSEEKMREAARMRENAEQFFHTLMNDPDAIFRDPRLAKHKRALLEKWAPEIYEEDTREIDPREQELRALKERLEKYEQQEKQTKEQKIEAEKRQFIESRKTEISTTLAEAMKATHLSAHPESAAAVLREMAVYMRAAKERGETVTPEELVEHVHRNRFTQMYTLAHQYEGDDLIEFLGDEIVNRIRRADLARLKKSREIPVQSWKSDNSQSQPRGQEKFIDPNDIRFAMRSFR